MITALHSLVYAEDADAARAFFRDVVGWPHVDAGGGWLIFAMPPSEVGVHPADAPHHEVSLMCEDIASTVAELQAKGAEFRGEIEERRFGRAITIVLPGDVEILLYEPTHPTAI